MPQERYGRRFGDRREGRLLRSIAPYSRLMPFLMKDKSDASNYFADSVEISHADRFLSRKRAEGMRGLEMLHLFIAAYIRTIAMQPALNRFVSGQRIYARHSVDIVITLKNSLHPDSTETPIKVQFDPSDTIYDVYRRINEEIDAIKATDGANFTEAAALMRIPRLILRFVVGGLKLLDYFGKLPRALLKISPFHGSMVVTDPGSLGIAPIYRHLYNFGNLPSFLSFGAKRRVVEPDKTGVVVENKYIDYKSVLDGRICDVYYYASAFKFLKHFLRNPELLEEPPEKVYEDIF